MKTWLQPAWYIRAMLASETFCKHGKWAIFASNGVVTIPI